MLRSCTLFSASSFFCLIVFFRKEIKKRNALRKSSFLSFLFPFFLPPPLFRFLLSLPFPSEVAMTFFFLLSFSRSHFSRKLLFGFKCRRGIVSPFDVTSGQAEVRVAFWSDEGGSVANYIAKDQFYLNSCSSDSFFHCINTVTKEINTFPIPFVSH